jgi:hypothetical protein
MYNNEERDIPTPPTSPNPRDKYHDKNGNPLESDSEANNDIPELNIVTDQKPPTKLKKDTDGFAIPAKPLQQHKEHGRE